MAADNPKSYALKQQHLFNICTHFSSGRKSMKRLRKCVMRVQKEWIGGDFALNDKERTLLSYMLFQEAVVRRDYRAIIDYGMYLLNEDRLSNHAVELLVEYEDVLQSLNPQPQALVKNYQVNYLEYLFFVLMNTFVKEGQWPQALSLLQGHELASCRALFELLHSTDQKVQLHIIEATVQQDIALLVDGSTHNIRESQATWQAQYLQKNGAYDDIALQTSTHVCNVLKVLFVAEQDVLVEKLLVVYKKYLLVPAHFEQLRQFIEQRTAIVQV